MQAEEHHSEIRKVAGVKLNLTCAKIGSACHCRVTNVDPGAIIARATAAEAEALALQKARERLKVKAA